MQPVDRYDKKVSCCGGAPGFPEPEKSRALIKDIIEAGCDDGADMIVTPCPVCQMNVEVYQDKISIRYGIRFSIPVTYYSILMPAACGKGVAPGGQIIPAKKLEKIAGK